MIPFSGIAGNRSGDPVTQTNSGAYTLDLLPLGTVVPLPTAAVLAIPALAIAGLARTRRRS